MLAKSNVKTYVVFSNSAYRKNPDFYRAFVRAVESVRGVQIKDRWFERQEKELPRKIYLETLRAIRDSNVVIAETSAKSTGVGQQIAYAIAQKKQTFICMSKKSHPSGNNVFLHGTISPFSHNLYYGNFQELERLLSQGISKMSNQRLEKFNFIASRHTKEILRRESAKHGISQSELLRRIIEEWAEKN